jgi:hypothetical protein
VKLKFRQKIMLVSAPLILVNVFPATGRVVAVLPPFSTSASHTQTHTQTHTHTHTLPAVYFLTTGVSVGNLPQIVNLFLGLDTARKS